MIPAELLTMGLSTILGIGAGIIKQKIQLQKMQLQALTVKSGLAMEATNAARDFTNEGFMWTRRVIALASVFAIIVLPKLAVLMAPELSVWVSWTEWQNGFLWFTDGKDTVMWKEMKGALVITPLDTHLVASVIGLYFGGSLMKH